MVRRVQLGRAQSRREPSYELFVVLAHDRFATAFLRRRSPVRAASASACVARGPPMARSASTAALLNAVAFLPAKNFFLTITAATAGTARSSASCLTASSVSSTV